MAGLGELFAPMMTPEELELQRLQQGGAAPTQITVQPLPRQPPPPMPQGVTPDQYGQAVQQQQQYAQTGGPIVPPGVVPKGPPQPAGPGLAEQLMGLVTPNQAAAPPGAVPAQQLPPQMQMPPEAPQGPGMIERMLSQLPGATTPVETGMREGVGKMLGFAQPVTDIVDNWRPDNQAGLGLALAGAIPIPGAKGATKLLDRGSKIAKGAVERTTGKAAQAVPPGGTTGSLNPLDNVPVRFQGKPTSEFTPEEWAAYGQHYGTDKPLGPLTPLQALPGKRGKTVQIPGGLEGEFTYYDLLHLKANPINPNDIPAGLHNAIQQKFGRTMTSAGGTPTDAQVWNGLIFGMTSPANPLFSNQVAQSRLRLRDPKMLEDLGSMISWKAGDNTIPKETRLAHAKRIADRYGLGAAEGGGLGVRGNADYTRIAELAQMFKENPGFFRKGANEPWEQFVERISSQVPGLAMKTGSFGTVWQDPATAAVSAIDRHMARELEKKGGIFASDAERAGWEKRALDRYNATRKPGEEAATFDEMASRKGTDSHLGGMLLEHVGATLEPVIRGKGGKINPNLPPHLAQAKWVVEPKKAAVMGEAYKRALALNQQQANRQGLGLFMSQWLTWDKIRQRLEPHENMFPGLEKTPAPNLDDLRGTMKAHMETGHKTTEKTDEGKLKPTIPLKGSPSRMGYLGIGGTGLGLTAAEIVAGGDKASARERREDR